LNTKDSIARPTTADPLDAQSLNPGNLRTNLNRHTAEYLKIIFNFLFVYPTIFGAYTELFGGLSPDIMNADWVSNHSRPELRTNVEHEILLTIFIDSCALGTHLSFPKGYQSSCKDRGRRWHWSRTGILGVV